jgi:hypothetical protein
MSTNFFSSLSGNFDYMSSMSGLIGDYASIKNGSYGSLMKSYVNKVGNKAALTAYRETGSTTVASEASDSGTAAISSSKTKTIPKSSFVDNIGGSKKSVSTDSYAKYKSSWLDDQLKQYDKDANKTTAADTSVSMDTTI